MSTATCVQYARWIEAENEEETGYWELSDSLSDAVGSGIVLVHVYRATFRSLGRFKKAEKVFRVKKRKKRAR